MRFDFSYAAFVHITGWDETGADKLAQPCCGFWVEFVVVVHLVCFCPARTDLELPVQRTEEVKVLTGLFD